MRRIPHAAAVLALALCAVLGLSTGPAVAAVTWSVSGGGAFSAPSTTSLVLINAGGTPVAQCASSTATGSAPNGAGLSGSSLIGFTGFSFTGCTTSLGTTFTTSVGTLPLAFAGVSYSAASGTTAGVVHGFVLVVQSTLCAARFSGTLTGTYNNTSHNLALSGSLTASQVTGCLGLVSNGDLLSYTITYHFATLHITSP